MGISWKKKRVIIKKTTDLATYAIRKGCTQVTTWISCLTSLIGDLRILVFVVHTSQWQFNPMSLQIFGTNQSPARYRAGLSLSRSPAPERRGKNGPPVFRSRWLLRYDQGPHHVMLFMLQDVAVPHVLMVAGPWTQGVAHGRG